MNTVTTPQYLPDPPKPATRHFRAEKFDFWSFFFSGLTGLATLFILGILATILLNILVNGWSAISWHFVSTIPKKDFFDAKTTGVLPMIVGTSFRVIVMTIFVIPVGVITAIYLTEYAANTSITTRIIRAAVNNLAGVPSIVMRTSDPNGGCGVASDAAGVVGWWVNPQAPGIDACGQAIKLMELTLATNS